ncbi:MAG: hypothetical protein HKP37_04455 [Boseongicola sp.]|nr:hypothetical protein [Boseongicola sp.]
MGKLSALGVKQTFTGHTAIRLLIVSYFVALAAGLIAGTDLAVLANPFLPEPVARVVSGLGVIGLSAMILIGFHRRLAALLLAIILFWCSYLTSVSPAGIEDIGSFWRDLALIGALLLTYADAEGDTLSNAYGTLPEGGDIASETGMPGMNTSDEDNSSSARSSPRSALFREDFDIVRAS